ncbi:hypothetical protein [Maribacter antarcticus]|uniref:hypothetical protein n=1 Tax=Maribacter antarcticus TaxID=505250 RepID=UPI0012EBD955|nr:hypothetical protein [Maribacter antarcticus]
MIDTDWVSGSVSINGLLLFASGLFLLYKAAKALQGKVEEKLHDVHEVMKESSRTFSKALTRCGF